MRRDGPTANDVARKKRAQQAVKGQADGFLQRADRAVDWSKLQRLDWRKVASAGTTLALVAMVAYVVMILVWFRLYHSSFAWSATVFVLLLLIAALSYAFASRAAVGRMRYWITWGAFFFVQSALVGLIVGFFLYFRSLAYYWRYTELRSYTNVAAAQQADAFADASMFLWSEDTRLDTMRSVGYRSKWTGETYCVAPIVDGVMGDEDTISYWAVGDNCCNARAAFWCGDQRTADVRSALVVLEPEDVVRPFMQWAVMGAAYPRYERGIRLQEATFATKAAKVVKLVTWTRDPFAAMDAYYTDAAWRCVWLSLGYFVLLEWATCTCAGYLLLRIRPLGASYKEHKTEYDAVHHGVEQNSYSTQFGGGHNTAAAHHAAAGHHSAGQQPIGGHQPAGNAAANHAAPFQDQPRFLP